MIFQDPSASLDPLFTIGKQLVEVITNKQALSRARATQRAIDLLSRVEIAAPERRLHAYPHEFSGGMKQRVMIALALAGEPKLLLADEPTTGLDVTIQDQILFLLRDICSDSGMAMILVSHDMGVIAQACDKVAVMYAGYITEIGSTTALFAAPRHPYTRALLAATPRLGSATQRGALQAISGQPPNPGEASAGCPFSPRCPVARPECAGVTMELQAIEPEHHTACPFERSLPPMVSVAQTATNP
jgi:oligopeptide/dipeptide ABC transporter ATP-binding protein